MKPLDLYYYRRSNDAMNFGDDLSPVLLQYATGRDVQWASPQRCQVIGIGSILERALKFGFGFGRAVRGLEPPIIWGSGLPEPRVDGKRPKLNFVAVRGTQTAKEFKLNAIPLGDPGLLAKDWFQERAKTHRIGLVPHYSDKNHPGVEAFCAAHKHVLHIPVERSPEEVLRDISRCELIVSSSLHGLIIADAFGIPNFKATFFGKIRGGQFKFDDYATALNRQPLIDTEIDKFDPDAAIAQFEGSHFNRIDDVNDKLRAGICAAI